MIEESYKYTGSIHRSLVVYKSGEDMLQAAKKNRKKALLFICRYCVRLSDRRRNIREVWSENPPSLGELVKMVGEENRLIEITRERRSLRALAKAIPYYKSEEDEPLLSHTGRAI